MLVKKRLKAWNIIYMSMICPIVTISLGVVLGLFMLELAYLLRVVWNNFVHKPHKLV